MRGSTLLAGFFGFALGKASQPEPVVPDWEPAPRPIIVEQQEPYPGDEELRRRLWHPFTPRNPSDWAYNPEDQTPRYPRLGRQWEDGLRAEYLYYIPAGKTYCFQQPAGADNERQGPGWVLVRDEPAHQWWVSEVMNPSQLYKVASSVVVAKLKKSVLQEYPWGKNKPVAVGEAQLAPLGWWEADPENDPIFHLQYPWVYELGFTKTLR